MARLWSASMRRTSISPTHRQAPAVDHAGLPRRARPAADLRGIRHVDRGAIQKVSQEIGGSSIELAEELSLLSAELSYLPDRRMAYEGLAKRTNHPGVKSVATAMIQAEPTARRWAALRTMAKENRDLRLSAAEKKAAALPAKLTVPMILFFLPVLFIVILGPAIINIQDTPTVEFRFGTVRWITALATALRRESSRRRRRAAPPWRRRFCWAWRRSSPSRCARS
jgi:hypothetical protein